MIFFSILFFITLNMIVVWHTFANKIVFVVIEATCLCFTVYHPIKYELTINEVIYCIVIIKQFFPKQKLWQLIWNRLNINSIKTQNIKQIDWTHPVEQQYPPFDPSKKTAFIKTNLKLWIICMLNVGCSSHWYQRFICRNSEICYVRFCYIIHPMYYLTLVYSHDHFCTKYYFCKKSEFILWFIYI